MKDVPKLTFQANSRKISSKKNFVDIKNFFFTCNRKQGTNHN